MKYKSIIFDLDDTLYDYQSTHKYALKKTLEICSENTGLSIEKIKEAYNSARASVHMNLLHTAASHNRVLYFQKMLELLACDFILSRALYDVYWDSFIEKMELHHGVEELLTMLNSNSVKIGILTDLTTHIQLRKLEKLGISKFVDGFVSSEEVGCEKPSASMYLTILNKLDSKPSEALMVGDSYSKDIDGALAIGMDAIWLKDQSLELNEGVVNVKTIPEVMEVLLCAQKQ